MYKSMWKAKIKVTIILAVLLSAGCISKENDPINKIFSKPREQCVTPLRKLSADVSPNGISTIPDGSLFGVSTGDVLLFDNEGNLLWKKEPIGSRYALLLDNGRTVLVSLDSEGNVLWERETGLIGVDGLAATPDGSFIAVGATDQEKSGHLMLFDKDGTKLWDHQIDGRIETVAVSKSGYVTAGPRDQYIYLFDCKGDLVFKYFAHVYYDAQDTVIAPDETFFLFTSERKYLNCHTLKGELVWQKEVGPICTIRISADSEYIALGTTNSRVLLLDRHGNVLWDKKVTSDDYVIEVAISGHGDYVVVPARDRLVLPTCAVEVYSKAGELLWRYEEEMPFEAFAISDDGHYLAASNGSVLLFFDNFSAIEEYKSRAC
ncbi:MAG: PQQ-binding-like beta-propeller repeat protein [Theionarchaea archaeon]|nr:PQQ-binding-like beta-propeller repeat protein [Theionarchaea archaeon]